MKNPKQKLIALGAGALLFISIGAGAYFIGGDSGGGLKDSTEDNLQVEQVRLVSKVYGMTKNGVISLYDIETAKKVGDFDLKSLSEPKKKIVTQTVEVEEKVEPEEQKTLDNYVLVERVIEKGDSTWKIQQQFTPNENVAVLLPTLQKLNDGKFLHPIYPGEKRVFLQPKGDASPKYETVKKTETVKKEEIVSIPDDQLFVYYKDTDKGTLYAYNDFDNAVYKVTVSKGEIKVEELMQDERFGTVSEIIVKDGRVFLASAQKDSIIAVTFDQKEFERVETGSFDTWEVIGDDVYTTHEKSIRATNIESKEVKEAMLGDATRELIHYQDVLLAMNEFGEYTENAVLYQIEPKTLKVNALAQIKTDVTELLANGNHEHIYVGRTETLKELNGEVKEVPKIVRITDKFTMEDINWQMPYPADAMSYSRYIYTLQDGQLQVFHEGKTKPSVTIAIDGEDISLIP